MRSLIEYLDCGKIYKDKESYVYRVNKFLDINNKIIPFLKKYLIQGVKYKDFEYWCKITKMMEEGKHLTREGIEQIRKIKAGMNIGRKFS